jgi:hypothetical protein
MFVDLKKHFCNKKVFRIELNNKKTRTFEDWQKFKRAWNLNSWIKNKNQGILRRFPAKYKGKSS